MEWNIEPAQIHDVEMVKRYLAGDRRIQKKLYDTLRSQIVLLVAKMELRGARFLDRDDLVSDILCQIMVKDDSRILRAFSGRSKLSTYLWPIIRFRVIDAIRRERRYHDHMVRLEDLETAGESHQDSVVELVVTEHLAAEPEQDKFIKYAKWLAEMSYEEIMTAIANEFPGQPPVSFGRIAYILHDNRKKILKKLKIRLGKFD